MKLFIVQFSSDCGNGEFIVLFTSKPTQEAIGGYLRSDTRLDQIYELDAISPSSVSTLPLDSRLSAN